MPDFLINDLRLESDGSFFVKIYPSKLKKSFGYYSNGFMPSNSYNLVLEKDRIIVKEIID
jgi:hypothetical protein